MSDFAVTSKHACRSKKELAEAEQLIRDAFWSNGAEAYTRRDDGSVVRISNIRYALVSATVEQGAFVREEAERNETALSRRTKE